MPINLGAIRQAIQWRLDDNSSAKFWSPEELNYWINEALRDIARRTETLQFRDTTIVAQVGQNKYPLELNALRVHRIEFTPNTTTGSPQIYPLVMSTEYNMDQNWGTWQNVQRQYPSWATFWGTPPNLTLQLYPSPSQQGHLTIWYYGLPPAVADDEDVLMVVEGWWDLVEKYVEYVALRKDRDDRWSDSKDIYESDLDEMIDKTRLWHDQPGQITRGWGGDGLAWGGLTW